MAVTVEQILTGLNKTDVSYAAILIPSGPDQPNVHKPATATSPVQPGSKVDAFFSGATGMKWTGEVVGRSASFPQVYFVLFQVPMLTGTAGRITISIDDHATPGLAPPKLYDMMLSVDFLLHSGTKKGK